MTDTTRIVRASTAPGRVRYLDVTGKAVFDDDRAHFEDGVLRLLAMDVATFEHALSLMLSHEIGEGVAGFGGALLLLRPPARLGTKPGVLMDAGPDGQTGEPWHPWIAKAPDHGVAKALDGELAWLVRPLPDRWEREITPPVYDEGYFEGGQETSAYRSYLAENEWRVNKGRHQLAEIQDWAPEPIGRTLDIGSGYGYFRLALAEAGIQHYGLDVSDHAAAIAYRRYGFSTSIGQIEDHSDRWAEHFDLITLWDVVEHVPDAMAFLEHVAHCLRPGGKLVLKTPNLNCPEAQFLGPHYHSLQRPHLLYFTPTSLESVAGAAGLRQLRVDTTSHLLRGFVGQEQVDLWAEAGQGADFTAYLVKD